MSDLNNKHIPSDLESMTAKDLRELVLIQIEHGQQAEKENTKLREQLEKAKATRNEVEFQKGQLQAEITNQKKETEKWNSRAAQLNKLTKKANAERDELALFLDKFARSEEGKQFLYGKPTYEKASTLMRKRDIEQQIKALEDAKTLPLLVATCPMDLSEKICIPIEYVDEEIEQLRKELE